MPSGKPRNLLGVDVPVNVPNPKEQRQLLNTFRNLPYDNSRIIIDVGVDDVQTALETLGTSAQVHELRIRDLDVYTSELSAAVVANTDTIAVMASEIENISAALSGMDARIDTLETLDTSAAVYAKDVIYELDTAGVTGSPYLAPLSAGQVQEAIDYLITRYDPFVRHSEAERLALVWGLPETGWFVYQTDTDAGLWEWTGFEWNKLGVTTEGGTVVHDASLLPTISGASAVGTWVWWDDNLDLFISLEELITTTNPNSGSPYIDDYVIDRMKNDTLGVMIERKFNPNYPGDGKTEYIVDVLVHGSANVSGVVAGDTYYFDTDGSLTTTKPINNLQPIKVGFAPNDDVLYVDVEYPRLQSEIFGGYF